MLTLLQHPVYAIVILLASTLACTLAASPHAARAIRLIMLISSIIALHIGILACLSFDKALTGFQFLITLNYIPEYNLSFSLGVDGLSMLFLLLTLFIFPVLFLAAWDVSHNQKQFLNYLLAMELLLVLTFSITDILYFFVLFEGLLIPMFILIGVWGARERKIKAAYYFFLYTLFGSLFMLFGLFYLYSITGGTNFYALMNELTPDQQCVIWLCFFMAFAVKMPLFPLHIWLPEAHVEAPTVGSMLLASLLLKLGGYGFLRFSISLLPEGSLKYAAVVSCCALLGVIYGSLATIRQIDLKRIIAYSSVAHMNLVMLSLFSLTQQGIEGGIHLMVGHAIVSTGLFFCVGVIYDRHHTRLISYYSGLVTVMPLFAAAFFVFNLANMGFPGTSNFVGEYLAFNGIYERNSTVAIFSTFGVVLSAVYSTLLFGRPVFGTLKTTLIHQYRDLTRREAYIFICLLVQLAIVGLHANFILDFVHLFVKSLVLTNEYAISTPLFDGPAIAVCDKTELIISDTS